VLLDEVIRYLSVAPGLPTLLVVDDVPRCSASMSKIRELKAVQVPVSGQHTGNKSFILGRESIRGRKVTGQSLADRSGTPSLHPVIQVGDHRPIVPSFDGLAD
jgi:hypothetical protein